MRICRTRGNGSLPARQAGHAAVAAFAVGLLMALPAYADSTAKRALAEVNAAARRWQSDAIVTHVSTLAANPDGTARSWLYTIYSPRARKSAILTARGTEVEVEEVNRNTSVDPVGDFMDSDKAMEAARKAGLKLDKQNGMGLTMMGQATRQPRVLWSVTVMTDSGFSSVTLDSKEGTLVKRDDVKLK